MSNKTVKVIAIQTGFYCGLREEGDVFEIPESMTANSGWFKPVTETAPANEDPNNGYSRMNKELLTQEAVAAGIEITGSETKAQIIELLTANKDSASD